MATVTINRNDNNNDMPKATNILMKKSSFDNDMTRGFEAAQNAVQTVCHQENRQYKSRRQSSRNDCY